MKKIIVMATLVLSGIAGVLVANASAPSMPASSGPIGAPYTSRYPVIDDVIGQPPQEGAQQQIDALRQEVADLRGQVGALQLLRAHDIEQRDTFRAADLQAWRDARAEDNKRIAAVEWGVNALWNGCR